jgi:MFS family permease
MLVELENPTNKEETVIHRNVFFMGIVSLLNDVASEMIYPIVPIFLTTILGAPIQIIGLIEGLANSTASLLKIISGWLSDKFKRRKIFVVFGYSLSSLSKIIIGLASSWHFVLGARFIDRFGKGTRDSARDALIADNTKNTKRGRAFGFHRAMDSLGAVLGSLIALLLISLCNINYSKIFFIAFIPSALGILILILFVRDKRRLNRNPSEINNFSFKSAWKSLDVNFKFFLLISIIFAIGNSSDVFMILRAQNLGLSVTLTILAYVLFNFSYSLFSYPAGIITDKIGPRKVLIFGYILFAAVYLAFGLINQSLFVWILFPIYGLFMALTDGVSRSYISAIVPDTLIGTAFGAYQTVTGLGAFLASFIAGWLWNLITPSAPFIFGGVMAIITAILFIFLKTKPIQKTTN